MYSIMVCTMDFYTKCFTVNVMSMHPIPPLSPHLNSGNSYSSTFCDLSWIIPVAVFPTTSIKAIPLQLLQFLRPPFFGMGTIVAMASIHAFETYLSSIPMKETIIMVMNSSSLHPFLTSSRKIFKIPKQARALI